MAKLTKAQKQELASIKVWSEINQDLVEKYPRIVEEEVNEFQAKVLEMVEQIGWEGVFAKLSTVQLTTKSGSKMEKCVDIYNQMIDQPNVRRIDIIKEFMSQQDMSKEGASTYFQNIRTKLKKSTV